MKYVLALAAVVTSGGQKLCQDLATYGIVVHDQNLCTGVVRHSSLDSDENRSVIVFRSIFTEVPPGLAAKNDLVIGNGLDCG